ncbi:hypothetical protein ON010_g12575 [Phytophthora cinnamomi]|nr:hypothetical protein ON010_g12575 [Phytophthora cinnamomi]
MIINSARASPAGTVSSGSASSCMSGALALNAVLHALHALHAPTDLLALCVLDPLTLLVSLALRILRLLVHLGVAGVTLSSGWVNARSEHDHDLETPEREFGWWAGGAAERSSGELS